MLSVLVPVFNWRVEPFISSLSEQASRLPTGQVEILVYDDGSSRLYREENQGVSNLPLVEYREMERNMGRSAIRNRLAKDAQGEWLLFLDCDGAPVMEGFLEAYLNSFESGVDVVCGGRTYSDEAPTPDRMLHYLFGTRREATPVSKRASRPYDSFMTNNFAIRKELFQSIGLDETLVGYGHEDTLLGVELKKNGANILHINAPVLHDHVETNDEFLEKTDQGLKNLALLYQRGALKDEVRVLKAAQQAKAWHLVPLVRLFFGSPESLKKKLRSGSAGIRQFDMYKLQVLARHM